MVVRFYSSGAPRWWPFQVITPGRSSRGSHILLDNGMWSYWKQQRRPPTDVWLARLARVASSLEAEEVIVILPDWLGDPRFTLEAARDPVARRLCRNYQCMVVAHSYNGIEGFYAAARELASLDHVVALAAPLKLPCRNGKRVPSRECQARIVAQVVRAAREYGLQWVHGLGVLLRPSHVRRLVDLGLSSFDSASWTRPNSTVLRRYHPYSAKSNVQKDLFFRVVLGRLLEAGVPLEGPSGIVEEVVSRG